MASDRRPKQSELDVGSKHRRKEPPKPFFLAYRCLQCGCIHGWIDHPLVTLVTKHHRGPMEDVWWCPRCDRQNRTHDGSWFGQSEKLWEQLSSVEEAEKPPFMCQDIFGGMHPSYRHNIRRRPPENPPPDDDGDDS